MLRKRTLVCSAGLRYVNVDVACFFCGFSLRQKQHWLSLHDWVCWVLLHIQKYFRKKAKSDALHWCLLPSFVDIYISLSGTDFFHQHGKYIWRNYTVQFQLNLRQLCSGRLRSYYQNDISTYFSNRRLKVWIVQCSCFHKLQCVCDSIKSRQ